MLGDYIWYKSDNFISFPIARKTNAPWRIVMESLAGLGAFLVVSTVLLSVFSPQSVIVSDIVGGVQSIFHLLATSTPILKGSKFLTLIGWGIIVPIVETTFFNGRLLEGLASYSEVIRGKAVSLKKFSMPLIMVMIVVASLFTLFHITAKGLDSVPLMITFLFSIISSVLVIRHQELRGAILLHICTNSAAVASSFGWI
jgi:hypothetical protein